MESTYKKMVASEKSEEITEKEIKEKEVINNSIKELLGHLFFSRDQTHLWHFQTSSYAKHKALDNYYTILLCLTDKLIEAFQGKYDKMSGELNMRNLDGIMQVDSFTLHFKELKEKIIPYYEYFSKCEDLKNILAEIEELINSTLYMLKLN